MKVTEKQLLIMIRVLEGSLKISDRADMNIFGYNYKTRAEVFNQIMNQQSEELKSVSDELEITKE
jgi:hypothetical protein